MIPGRRATGVLCVLACVVVSTPGQDLAEERDRVLTLIGTVKDVDLPLHPLRPEVGVAFVQDLHEPEALSLRVHFVLQVEDDQEATTSWSVTVKDASGNPAWSISANDVSTTRFWSGDIEGNKVTVEVTSTQPSNPTRLVIDKIAIRKEPIIAVSISGRDQLASILGQDAWIVAAGKSVARLRIIGDNGRVYPCTGFLVTRDLLLTNQHCIASQTEMESALVDFDYDEESNTFETHNLAELLQASYDFDYALVRLAQDTGREPLALAATRVGKKEQLLIIQHPAGEAKQVSIADCKVKGALQEGRGPSKTDLGHRCDTIGGSSGSPVFRFETQNVIGLHHLGFRRRTGELFNRAVHIDLVLADLAQEHREQIQGADHE